MSQPQPALSNQPSPALIGREHEVDAIGSLLTRGRERLVTLTGTGGAGKTSLALEVATRCRLEFPDGIFVVELGRIADPALVAPSVGEAIGTRPGPLDEPLVAVVGHLGERRALLVLDNCEHVVDDCTVLASRILAGCPNVRLLATSREPLQLPGERQFRVRPLALPTLGEPASLDELASCPAVRLFVERVEATSPGFALTAENAAVVAEICVRLEGIPLAIELAAARARVLALEQIRDRLDDCIDLLGGGSKSAPRRQQTLRGTLDWSYNLLDGSQQATFRRLGAFVGWLDLDAAEDVCGEPDAEGETVLDTLAQLADRSLLVVEHGQSRARYRLLEPVRQYARHRLEATGEAETVYSRHLEHYVDLAERLEPLIWGGTGNQVAALNRLESLRDSTSAALSWGVTHNPPLAARLAGSVWHFWRLRGFVGEGRHWLEALLGDEADLGVAWGKVTVGAAFLARDAGDIDTSEARSYRAIAISNEKGDAWTKGVALLNLGILANLHGDYALAQQRLLDCLACCRQTGHQWGIGSALYHLGYVARVSGDLAAARDLLEESLAVHHAIGDSRGVSVVLGSLGRVYFLLGESDRASAFMEESRAIGERLGIRDNSGLGLAALLARSAGDYARARELTRQGLDLLYSSGLHRHVPEHLCIQGTLLIDEGICAEGVKLISAAMELGLSSGQIDSLVAHTLGESSLEAARSALGERAYSQAWEEGRLLSLSQAVELATSALPAADQPQPTPKQSPEAEGGPSTLTPREREVAELIAKGLSDRQIAEALTITVGTAGVHVHRILDKLGVRSRWQVADWVERRKPAESAIGPRRRRSHSNTAR